MVSICVTKLINLTYIDYLTLPLEPTQVPECAITVHVGQDRIDLCPGSAKRYLLAFPELITVYHQRSGQISRKKLDSRSSRRH